MVHEYRWFETQNSSELSVGEEFCFIMQMEGDLRKQQILLLRGITRAGMHLCGLLARLADCTSYLLTLD